MIGGLATALITSLLHAQADEDLEDIIELSPFTVTTEEQQGYVATNTLAGTRLKTNVEDVASAISIYTEEFIDDIGATNANELLIFTPGLEAGGSQGNFGVGGTDSAGARTNPQYGTRARGLSAPSLTRGFFVTDIPFDSYNTGTVTVNRGPNGILFGIGSPAGIVDSSVKQANFNRNQTEVSFRFGDNGSARASLDVNRILMDQKLALRVALLTDQEKFDQKPAFDDDNRFYTAVQFRPLRYTTLRANFEVGEIEANRPLAILPEKGYSQFWLDAGMPTNNWRFWDDPALNPNAANEIASRERDNGLIGQRDIFMRPGFIYNDGSVEGATPDFGIMGVIQQSANRAGRVRPGLFHPTVNRDVASDTYQWLATRNINTVAGSYFPGGERPAGIVPQGFTDYSEFNWNSRLFDETSRQFNDFDAFNVSLEQLFFEGKMGIEVAYDNQSYQSDGQMTFATGGGSARVRIDVNEVLPDGSPNPNVGRPYVLNASGTQPNSDTGRETMRATVFFKHDFTTSDNAILKWLGSHSVTGLVERNEIDSLNWATRFTSNFQADSSLSPAFDSGSRTPSPIVYLGDSILDGSPVRLNPIRISPFVEGTTARTSYFAVAANDLSQGDFQTYDVVATEYTREGQYSNEVIDSQALVLQSYWLSDHVITTLGWREDTSTSQSLPVPRTDEQTEWSFSDFDLSNVTEQEVTGQPSSIGIVAKVPDWINPFSDTVKLSFFYNESDNFTPSGTRVNVYGDPLPAPSGETTDYGVNLGIGDGLFNLRFNVFETNAVNNSYNPGLAMSRAARGASVQMAEFWANDLNAVDENGNPAPIDRRDDFQKILDALPPNYAEVYGFTGFVQDDAGIWFANIAPPGNVTDTQDFSAEGMELEITYNPTRSWRILANVAQQETVRTNVAPWTQDIVSRLNPVWAELADQPRGAYPPGFVPGDTLPDGTVTVGSYAFENVTVPLAGVLANEGLPNSQQREWRFNFITNYTFHEGALKGWNVGGAYRWQDDVGIGFPFILDSNGNVIADITSPYTAPAESNYDFFVGYGKKLWSDKVEWKVQLNMKNVFGSSDPITVQAQYDGTPALVRVPPERRFYITNTFRF